MDYIIIFIPVTIMKHKPGILTSINRSTVNQSHPILLLKFKWNLLKTKRIAADGNLHSNPTI